MKIHKFAALLLAVFCLAGTAHADLMGVNGELIGHDDTPMPAPVIEYDERGKITKKYEQFFDGELRMYTEYAYDEAGNLLRKINGRADGTTSGNEYTYDENGVCTGRTVLYSDGTTTEYTYENDAQGNLLRTVGSDGSVVEYTNEYDGQGRLLSVMGSDGIGRTYEYREDGSYRVVHSYGSVEEYGSDGILDSDITSDGLYFRTYDDRGRMIKESCPDNDQEITWEYSEDGKLVRQISYLQDSVYTYEYDEEGYLLKQSSDVPPPYNEYVKEYSRTGMMIKETNGTEEAGYSYTKYREDGTISLYRQEGWYSIHREDGYPLKQVMDDGSYDIYRYDEDNLRLAQLRYSADGSFQYVQAPWADETGERGYEILTRDQGPVFKAFRNAEGMPIEYIMYEYDEEGNLLSRERLTPSEFDALYE